MPIVHSFEVAAAVAKRPGLEVEVGLTGMVCSLAVQLSGNARSITTGLVLRRQCLDSSKAGGDIVVAHGKL